MSVCGIDGHSSVHVESCGVRSVSSIVVGVWIHVEISSVEQLRASLLPKCYGCGVALECEGFWSELQRTVALSCAMQLTVALGSANAELRNFPEEPSHLFS